MRLLKREKDALAELLMQGAESPEILAEELVKRLDEMRGERTHVFACAIVAGVPISIGPLSTRNQAEKAIAKIGADKAWVVPGWTAEGWEGHISELDKEPEPAKVNSAEQKKLDSRFWAKVSEIREKESTALVGQRRQDIEIKVLSV